ncbi:hypothetical protein HY837_05415 [archaeon]|nr:hypothetical protein [archaeon]
MVNFEIKTLGDQKDLSSLLKFLESQPLNYPNYTDWVYGVCKNDLDLGYKSAYLAFRRRALGYFLCKQVEADARGVYDQLMVDADSKQKDIHHLLRFSGFHLLFEQHLYSGNFLDYIFVKAIKQN